MCNLETNNILQKFVLEIENIVIHAKQNISYSVNHTMIETYWNIGKHIVEIEQKGDVKAVYGKNY